MKFRKLGASGPLVSLVGLGCNNFSVRIDLAASRAVLHRALDLGVTLFDTADTYGRGGSESFLGELLRGHRDDVVLASKFGLPMDDARQLSGASRRYIMAAVEASLKRLRTDRIDLYQLHEPDPATPIEETLRALDDLIKQGKVRYIGCSNLPGREVASALATAENNGLHGFVSCQDEYSLVARGIERDLLPVMRARDLGLLPYFPLAGGLLTGKYRKGEAPPAGTRFACTPKFFKYHGTDANFAIAEKMQAFAAARGRTALELAFSWLAARPQVASIIAGATSAEQVEQNVAAGGWTLDTAEISEIDDFTWAVPSQAKAF
jgi:aryl-alcohol dehydrogenase-like predicted oxidoreductase